MRIPYTLLPSDTPLGKSFISKVPMVLLEFSEFYLHCLIDTGAVILMMPGEFGESLGLEVNRGEPFVISGIDSIAIPSYIHEVEFNINGIHCKIEVAFSYKFKFPYGLLGRKDFFDLFKLHFYQKYSYFELEVC